jgi:hypothetical protein
MAATNDAIAPTSHGIAENNRVIHHRVGSLGCWRAEFHRTICERSSSGKRNPTRPLAHWSRASGSDTGYRPAPCQLERKPSRPVRGVRTRPLVARDQSPGTSQQPPGITKRAASGSACALSAQARRTHLLPGQERQWTWPVGCGRMQSVGGLLAWMDHEITKARP